MKVLFKKPGEPFCQGEIENNLSALQEYVGGYIEIVPVTQNICFIVNEEGKLKGLKPNFRFKSDTVVGNALFCGVEGEDLRSLTDGEIASLENIVFVGGIK